MCQMSAKQADDCNLLVVCMGALLYYSIRAVLFGCPCQMMGAACEDCIVAVGVMLTVCLGVAPQWVFLCCCMKLNGSRNIEVLGVRWFIRHTISYAVAMKSCLCFLCVL